jgi:hypothetical protein
MRQTIASGVVIGGACAAWTFVVGLTGWYRHPVLLNLFFLVIVIEVGLIYRGLSRTAATNGYGAQVASGAGMSIVAAAIVFAASLVFTTVAFPTYFRDIEQAAREAMTARGIAEADIAARLEGMATTPLVQATQGAVGTIVTGLFASVLIGTRVRRRDPAAMPPA